MDSDTRKTKAQLISELDAARKRLRELEKYSIVEKSNDGIVIVQDGIIKFSNARASELYGYSKKEAAGKPFLKFVAPEYRSKVAEYYRKRLLGENVPNTYESALINREGSIISVEINASIVEFEGAPATLTIIRDESERTKQAEALAASEEKLRTIFNNSSDGIGVYFIDEATNEPGNFLEVNSTLCQWLGYSYDETMKLNPKDIVKIKPGELSFRDAVRKVTTEGNVTLERILVAKDGHEIPVEINAHTITYKGRKVVIPLLRNIAERQKSELLLRESEQKFKTLAEKSPNMVFINKGGKIVYANRQCENVMGYTQKELYHRTFDFMSLVAPENARKIRAAFQQHSLGKEIAPVEYSLVTKDKRRIECILATKLIDYEGSKAILGVVTDVTEQKRRQNALSLQAKMLDAVSDGIYVHGIDGILTYVNDATCKSLGYSKKELIGTNISRLHTAGSSRLIKPRIEELETKGELTFEIECLTKNGTTVPLEIHSAVIRVDKKRMIISIARDVTERHHSQEALAFQAKLLNASRDTIIVHDLDGNIVYVNDSVCEAFGYSRQEMLKMNLHQISGNPDTARSIRPRIEEVARKGHAAFEVTNRRKDGSEISREIHDSLLEIGGRRLIVGVGHDITEKKSLQVQMIMQDRLASIGQFVSGIAHELNNPLTSVIGFSELLLQRDLPGDIKADVRIVNDEAKRTSTIVKNLLTFARQQPQEKHPILISEPIHAVLELRSHQQMVNNLKVKTYFAPDLPPVLASNSQMQQVFFNLISNAEFAITEAHRAGTITITAKPVGHFVRVSIADDGPGITPENMKRLFSPFFTTKEPGKGTGLGLSVCQGIISEHNGHIWAESEPGKGATFFVELPVDHSPSSSAAS